MRLTFLLVRATTYSALFIGLLLLVLPARILSSTGVVRPPAVGPYEIAGMLLGAGGAALASACIVTFVFVGRGTPAPFDPPRRLVIRGPYRFLRNPMYLGAGLALLGAAVSYRSVPLLGYAVAFLRRPRVRRPLRGADVAPELRRGLRSVLPARRAVVAESTV